MEGIFIHLLCGLGRDILIFYSILQGKKLVVTLCVGLRSEQSLHLASIFVVVMYNELTKS
jgi:hypothetical protein